MTNTATTFWNRVDQSAGPAACWPWTGCRDANGYGWLGWHGQRSRAYRVALELDGRPVPAGLVARHLCHNRLCCNPAHLAIGTQAQNAQDSVLAGHYRARRHLTQSQVAALRHAYRHGLATSPELAIIFGVSASAVRHIGSSDKPYRGAAQLALPLDAASPCHPPEAA